MSEKVSYTQWLKRGTSTFIPTDNAKTVEKLEAGVYNLRYADGVGYYCFKKDLKLDELIELPMPESKLVLNSIKDFWKKEEVFKKYGFVYKRGILLYGAPGTGKTSLINILSKFLVEQMDGIVFILTSGGDLTAYEYVMPEIYRVIEPNRPIITVIEDIDGLCSRKDNETKLINILDGIEQLENVVYIATTNYTERLNERILNRPNRFDRRIEIKFPNTACRKKYIQQKLKKDDLAKIKINEWVAKTNGFTLAHIGEIIKSVIIFGHSLDESVDLMKALKTIPNSSQYNKEYTEIGFSNKKAISVSSDYYEDDAEEAIQSEVTTGSGIYGNDSIKE